MTIELRPGMTVGRYRLIRRIAEGGMGSVWAARDERLDREVAVKLIPRTLLDDPAAEQRFEREARALGRLQHGNVVSVFDIGTADPGTGEELPYLVMELIRGRSLNKILEGGPLPPRRAAKIMHQVAVALAAAHRAGVVHRDLKPSNIMVDDGGHVKVLDFGLARLTQREGQVSEETLTTPGVVLGSCPYMSPEQALGEKVGPVSDIFSCGSVLFEALTGRRAFDGNTPVQVMQTVARCDYPPLVEVAAETPESLAAVVDRCLNKDPSRRYPDASELARDLETILDAEDTTMTRIPTILSPGSSVRAVAMVRRRWVARVAAAALSCLVLGGLGGFLLGRSDREAVQPDPGRWGYDELLSVSGSLSHPSWHPGGGELAVEHRLDGRSDILAVPVDGSGARVLVKGSADASPAWPTFSPDGAALALSMLSGEDQRLHVVPAVGGEPVAVVENAAHPTWTDSDTILFSRVRDGASGLWSYRVDTGEERELLAPREDRWWWRAETSPRGEIAALGGPSDLMAGLYVGEGVAAGLDEWLAPGRRLSGYSWVPGGRGLVATVDQRLMWLTDSASTELLPRLANLDEPAVAPDGRRLAVVRGRTQYDLVSVDPDGGEVSCVLCGVRGMGWGSVSGDGAIAYRYMGPGAGRLMIREPGGAERPLTPAGEDGSCPIFSPDGLKLAYLAREEGRGAELRVISREGGQPVTLASDVESPEYPSWSPDGRFVAFAAGTPIRVWIVSAAGGEPRLLTPDGGDYPVWSPDGRWVAYVVWTEESDVNQGAWVVPADGGTALKVSDHPTRLMWSLDGRWLQQLRWSGGELELWRADARNWQWSRHAVLETGMSPSVHLSYRPFTADPATGRLVMNRRSSTSSLVVFDGLDPRRW
jgi:serine/threonine protein kinase/Tol biopolymer transport system component